MTTTAKLRAIKTAALKWVTAKDRLEQHFNTLAVNGLPPDPLKAAKLTRAYNQAEQLLDAAARCCEGV